MAIRIVAVLLDGDNCMMYGMSIARFCAIIANTVARLPSTMDECEITTADVGAGGVIFSFAFFLGAFEQRIRCANKSRFFGLSPHLYGHGTGSALRLITGSL